MNVPKKLIGKIVEITWANPNSGRGGIMAAKIGRAALATWTEYGIVHDVTDGVVLIAHSYATEPGGTAPDEMERTAVPEALIEKITVLIPQSEGSV